MPVSRANVRFVVVQDSGITEMFKTLHVWGKGAAQQDTRLDPDDSVVSVAASVVATYVVHGEGSFSLLERSICQN